MNTQIDKLVAACRAVELGETEALLATDTAELSPVFVTPSTTLEELAMSLRILKFTGLGPLWPKIVASRTELLGLGDEDFDHPLMEEAHLALLGLTQPEVYDDEEQTWRAKKTLLHASDLALEPLDLALGLLDDLVFRNIDPIDPPDVEEIYDALERNMRNLTARNARQHRMTNDIPECCRAAYDERESTSAVADVAWSHLERRLSGPARVAEIMNPWAGILEESFVPCRLDCENAEAWLKRKMLGRGKARGGGWSERIGRRLTNPYLVIICAGGDALELVPKTDVGDRFEFSVGDIVGTGPEVRAVADGDEMVLEDERLLVYRSGQPCADVSGVAYLWWQERCFQVPFWTRVLQMRANPDVAAKLASPDRDTTAPKPPSAPVVVSEPARLPPAPDPPEPPPEEKEPEDVLEQDAVEMSRQLRGLKRALETALGASIAEGRTFGGLTIWHVWASTNDELTMRFGTGDKAVLWTVAHAKHGSHVSLKLGPFALTAPTLDTELRRTVAKDLSLHLTAWLVARQKRRQSS
jgi:hypothetical protein